MTRSSPLVVRASLRAATGLAGLVLAAPLSAQTVTQQGWNPKEDLAKETYVKPPEIVERIVSAPRNSVAYTNPSPDHKYFLKTESEGLPSIDVFGKPHYRLGGVEIDGKANRARALTTRGSIGLTLLDPTNGASRTIETPKGAVVNGATWSPDGKSIGYIASFDARTDIYVADVATGKSTLITAKTPLLAARVTSFDWTADGKSIVTVLLPDNRPAEPKRPPVETGPLVRTSEAGKVLQNRNYASLLRDQYEKDLLDYYTLGQLAVIDVKSKTVKKIGAPALITNVDASPDGKYFLVTLQTKPYSYLVPVANFGTVEQLWDANGKVLTEIAKAQLREGTGGSNDSTPFAGGPGFGGRGGQSDTAKRNVQWNPTGAGLVYLEAEAGPAGSGGGGAGRAGRGGRGGGGGGGNGPARKDRLYLWSAPFGASDAKILFEANSRMTSAEFSDDGKTLFVNEGTDLYAVRLADPTKHYEIARGGTIATGGGRGRGGAGGGGGRGGAGSDSAFYSNPGALQSKRGPNGSPVVLVGADGKTVFLEGTKYFPDW